jgi:hypothetical protein
MLQVLTNRLLAEIEEVEQNAAFWEERSFEGRADAIDYLDFHVIDRIAGLLQITNPVTELLLLKQRAEGLKRQLEAVNTFLFERLRADIRLGRLVGPALLKLMNDYVGRSGDGQAQPAVGYDTLDMFTNGLLSVQPVPLETTEREPEMVYYQKTPARLVLELADKARLTNDDVFYDVGSGLGHVPMLVHLVSGATAKGIEVEPAYCAYATTCAADLNLPGVQFIRADARHTDYSDGTVFFMYTPFQGRMLQEVLDRLQAVSQRKQIRVFSYGPCTHDIARQNWLTFLNEEDSNSYKLSEFSSRHAF